MSKNIDTVKEFQHLFYASRREYRIWKQNVILDSVMSQKALTYAKKHNLFRADFLVQSSALEGQGNYDDALKLLDNASSVISPLLEGVVWHLRGVLYHSLARIIPKHQHHQDAINCYRKSLDCCDDINFPHACCAWIDLAQAYGDVGGKEYIVLMERSYSNVIDYDKVLPLRDCIIPGRAWIRIAQIYEKKGNINSTIKSYMKATEDPIEDSLYEVPSAPWLYVGREFFKIKEYFKTIEACQKALSLKFSNPSIVWMLIGKAYYLSNKFREAEDAFKHVIAKSGKPHVIFRREAEKYIEIIKSGLQLESLNADDRTSFILQEPIDVEQSEVELRILEKINDSQQDQYDKYLGEESSKRDNVLSILRGWSSSVTLLEGSERLWRGGGYFIKWQDKGIVIDPGFDFLRNFHDAGYHGREIDAVLVSHNHSDHNNDLTSLDDLRYELYKRRGCNKDGKITPYSLILDDDSKSAKRLSSESPKHMFRPILFDLGRCNPEDTISNPNDLPIVITYFKVLHGELENAVGFKIKLYNDDSSVFTIGYTGDTEFFPSLAERLKDCDILLAHISQPGKSEFSDPNVRKENHLGYRGLAELIKLAKPKLTLVGEFWAGLADLRIDLVEGLRQLTGNEAIMPTGIDMHINLPTLNIECSKCKKETTFDNIHIVPPTERFQNLSYLCSDCSSV